MNSLPDQSNMTIRYDNLIHRNPSPQPSPQRGEGAGAGITVGKKANGNFDAEDRNPLAPRRGERDGVRGEKPTAKTGLARRLRYASTDAERILWRRLRDRQLDGWKFRRQHPIGSYVTDFYCVEAALVVEVDGGQHALRRKSDRERTEALVKLGIRVIRFWNNDVLAHTDAVLEQIACELAGSPSPQPSPLGGEGEKSC
ncbi:MAG: endonuclease domain-containing protein [Gammaproteobacteria bacterium]